VNIASELPQGRGDAEQSGSFSGAGRIHRTIFIVEAAGARAPIPQNGNEPRTASPRRFQPCGHPTDAIASSSRTYVRAQDENVEPEEIEGAAARNPSPHSIGSARRSLDGFVLRRHFMTARNERANAEGPLEAVCREKDWRNPPYSSLASSLASNRSQKDRNHDQASAALWGALRRIGSQAPTCSNCTPQSPAENATERDG